MRTSPFRTGFCPRCDKETPAWFELDDEGSLVYRCVECDAWHSGTPRRRSLEHIRELGYALEGEEESGGGCGTCTCGKK